jgi:hypothetical protein
MAPTTKRKTKFSLLDLRAEVSVLQERLGSGSRVLNVYNLGRKTYLLKLSVPPLNASGRIPATETEEAWATGDSSWRREYLLIESGVRLHTTRFTRQAAAAGTAAASLVSRQKIGTDETLDNSIATDLAHMDLDERDREPYSSDTEHLQSTSSEHSLERVQTQNFHLVSRSSCESICEHGA